jgi:hypothetical protein
MSRVIRIKDIGLLAAGSDQECHGPRGGVGHDELAWLPPRPGSPQMYKRIKVKYLGPVPFARRWACHRDKRNTQSYTK